MLFRKRVAMTDQELRKLKRLELLEMMVEQGKAVQELRAEMDKQKEQITQMEAELQEKTETIERLKKKLDQKDADMQKQVQQISIVYKRLRNRLNEKDETIRQLQASLEKTANHPMHFQPGDTLDDATEQLSAILQSAERAANQYKELIQKSIERKKTK